MDAEAALNPLSKQMNSYSDILQTRHPGNVYEDNFVYRIFDKHADRYNPLTLVQNCRQTGSNRMQTISETKFVSCLPGIAL